MTNIETKVEKLIEPKINSIGYELYDVQYVKEGKDNFLRIYIDKEETGITLEDCELVSNEITNILDEADYINEQYFLEVSSSGVERILRKDKHLKANVEKKIQIKLFKPLESKKQYVGILKDFNDEMVQIFADDKTINIDRKNISQIKTVYDWEKI